MEKEISSVNKPDEKDINIVNDFVLESIGHRTSRYASEVLHQCPHSKKVKEAEGSMKRIIETFFLELNTNKYLIPIKLEPPLDYIDGIGKFSTEYGIPLGKAPKEYISIDSKRNGEYILDECREKCNDKFISDFIDIIDSRNSSVSISEATKVILKTIYKFISYNKYCYPENIFAKKEISDIKLRELCNNILNGVLLNETELENIIKLIHLQDKPYSFDDLEKGKELLDKTKISNILISFQVYLWRYSELFVENNPEWIDLLEKNSPLNEIFEYSNKNSNKIIANPHLLKVLGNNLLPAISSLLNNTSSINVDDIILGMGKMQSLGIFQSFIPNIQKTNEGKFCISGLINSVCPGQNMLIESLFYFLNKNKFMINTHLNPEQRLNSYKPIISSQLQSYIEFTKNEIEKIFGKETLDFVGKYENYLYRNNLDGHLTNSAWVTDPTFSYVLLIHHKKLDKWFQPGGHSEEVDITLQDGAMREAREETGLNHFKLKDENIFDIDVHEIPEKGEEPKHFHYDIRYWLIGDTHELDGIDKNEIIDAKWFHIEELEKMDLSDSIRRMLEKTKKEKENIN